MSTTITAVTEATYETEVLGAELPVLIDFWAPWCAPCRALEPLIERVAGEQAERLKVVKVNIDDNPALASQFNIRSIPTLALVRQGQSVQSLSGVTRTRLYALLDEHLG